MFRSIDKKTKSISLKFLFAAYFFYTISICIKMVYSAEMAEIITAIGSTKPNVSLGLLFYYAAYSISQLIFSFFIGKINLKWVFRITVTLTALSFGMMLFANELWHLYAILGLNGILQTPLWGGIMFYVGRYMPKEIAVFAAKFLPTGFAIGTALTYGMSAFLIGVLDWRATFVFFSLLTLLSLAVFMSTLKKVEQGLSHIALQKEAEQKAPEQQPALRANVSDNKRNVWRVVVFFPLICMLFCCVYYGIMGWFPNLLIENFGMPTEYSIFFTLLLPLTMAPGPFLAIGLQERAKHEHSVLLGFSTIMMAILSVLCFVFRFHIVSTILLTVLLLFFARAMCTFCATFAALRYSDRIEAGKFSLIINAFSGLMGGVIPYVVSFVLERTSWDFYFIFLCIFGAAALAMALFARIRETIKNNQNKPKHI